MTELTINGQPVESTDFKLIEGMILDAIRSWNNFTPEESMVISLKKLPDPSALEAKSSDGINAADLFGRA